MINRADKRAAAKATTKRRENSKKNASKKFLSTEIEKAPKKRLRSKKIVNSSDSLDKEAPPETVQSSKKSVSFQEATRTVPTSLTSEQIQWKTEMKITFDAIFTAKFNSKTSDKEK